MSGADRVEPDAARESKSPGLEALARKALARNGTVMEEASPLEPEREAVADDALVSDAAAGGNMFPSAGAPDLTGNEDLSDAPPDAAADESPDTPTAEVDEEGDPDGIPLPESAGPARPVATGERHWYIVKVQSNREDSIREGLFRRAKIAGMEDFFGEIVIPIEMVTEFKNGKKRVVKRKLYPGYIIVNMEVNEETFFLVRDTPGVGDFTGAGGKPVPMLDHEVERLIRKQDEKTEEAPKLKISFKSGDRVKINEGTFENFEGDVDAIDEANGRVTVMINIFGRSTPVELEYWQIETV